MPKFVQPKVHLIGYTEMDVYALGDYLKQTGNEDFLHSIEAARQKGLSYGEIMCSMFAKLCYKSLTLGKNANITRTRDIWDNLVNCFDQGHLSVFEHVSLNFVITDCSRVFTHELVRHRVGTAFSQTSGRYVRSDTVEFVHDPILDEVKHVIEETLIILEQQYNRMITLLEMEDIKDFTRKKKITSALRRILPNGQANEIGFSVNLRALRHTVQMRTSRHAEWEIRYVFNQVYHLTKARYPLLYYGAKEESIDDLVEVTGMRSQPYDLIPA